MSIKEEVSKRINDVRDALGAHGNSGIISAVSALAEYLAAQTEAEGIEECDLGEIKWAVEMCRRMRYTDEDAAEKMRKQITEAITACIRNKKRPVKDRILWARVLVSTQKGFVAKETAEAAWVSELSRVYYPAMEQEADELPTKGLMDWYSAFLSKDVTFKQESRMFNRLAYFWLEEYGELDRSKERAKAYFLAMERRGILPDNPYPGGYGDDNSTELIAKLLNDEYDEALEEHLNKRIVWLADEIASGRTSLINLTALRRNMSELQRRFKYGDNEINLELWDNTLSRYIESLKKCCDCASDEDMAEAAGTMAECLTNQDNWLLRYIEMNNEDGSEDKYFEMIEEWLKRIGKLSQERVWVMHNALQGMLANRYHELGETEKLISILDEMTATTDTAAHFNEAFAFYGNKRYCTPNTMALIKLLSHRGENERVEEIIREIDAFDEEDEGVMALYTEDKLWNCLIKYICLLDKLGYVEESRLWEKKLQEEYGMSDDELRCEIEYLKGNYNDALEYCRNGLSIAGHDADDERQNVFSSYKDYDDRKKLLELLEYICDEKLPERIDTNPVSIIPDKAGDAVHCRGSIASEFSRSFQLTNDEWHKFAATSGSMAEVFESGLRSEDRPAIYKADYYKIPLVYDPEPALMRGDFIRHLYENRSGSKWYGLRREDMLKLENVTISAK